MSKRPDSPMQRFTLWQWGLIVIFAGVMANLATGLLPSPGNPAAARGQALGRGLVTFLAVVAGIVLIVMHFMRRKRNTRSKTRTRRGRPSDRSAR